MDFYKEFIDKIKDHYSIESIISLDTNLTGTGILHGDHASLHSSENGRCLVVYPDTDSWFCFNCGNGGDIFEYEMSKTGESFLEVAERLAASAGITVPNINDSDSELRSTKRKIYDCLTEASLMFHKNLSEEQRSIFFEKGNMWYDPIKEEEVPSYGFTNATIDRYLIGLIPTNTTFILNTLIEKYGETIVLETGLFGKDETSENIFCYMPGRLSFPYFKNGKVVYLIGRITEFSPDARKNKPERQKYKKLRKTQYIENAFFYEEDSIRSSDYFIITEGVTDCISVRQVGIPCTSPVTVRFRKNDYEKIASMIKKTQTIYICNDFEYDKTGTKEGAGISGAESIARELEKYEKRVKIITLPLESGKNKIDLNDYLQNHTKEDFENLMKSASDIVEFKIGITKKLKDSCKIDNSELADRIKSILSHVASYDPIKQVQYKNMISKELNIPKKDINDFIKSVEPKHEETKQNDNPIIETINIMDIVVQPEKEPEWISPAQVFTDKKAYYLVYMMTKENEEIPVFITSDMEMLSYTKDTLDKEDMVIKDMYIKKKITKDGILTFLSPPTNRRRWGISSEYDYNVFQWISDDPICNTINPFLVYNKIKNHINKYVEFQEDKCYDSFMALWVMHTYCFQLFDSCCYGFVHGIKGSGKSHTLDILDDIVFNSEKGDHFTEAAIYRSIEQDSCTLLVDEAEGLNKENENGIQTHELEIYKAGYKKKGSVSRCVPNGDDYRVSKFSAYSPKFFGNIKGLEKVLEDRTVTIPIFRATKKITEYDYETIKKETAPIRNGLYVMSLKYWKEIKDIYRNLESVENLSNRHREIWKPIWTMAKIVDKYSYGSTDTFDGMKDLAMEVKREKESREQDEELYMKLLPSIWDYMASASPETIMEENELMYKLVSLVNYIRDQEEWDKYPKWLENVLPKELKKVGVIPDLKDHKKRIRTNGRREWYIKIDSGKLKNIMMKHGIPTPSKNSNIKKPDEPVLNKEHNISDFEF